MQNIPEIWKILNLNLKKYKIVECIEKKNTLIFSIKWKEKYCVCPQCWIKTNKRQDLSEKKQITPLKHINISNQILVELIPIKRYFRCNNCNSHFRERFDFESPNWFHTTFFEEYVIHSFWFISWNQIAKLNNTNASKIYRIIKSIDSNKLNETWLKILENLEEIYLWIDEHSFRWRDMILIITELKTKKLIAVLPNTTKESLESWIKSIPFEAQLKIKWFSTDMNKWYAKTIKDTIIWTPVHSVDKYHLFQEANRMVDEVRILNTWLLKMSFVKAEDIPKLAQEKKIKNVVKNLNKEEIKAINNLSSNSVRMNKYKPKAEQRLDINKEQKKFRDKKWELHEYNEITLDYYIEKWYRTIFLKREKNLSGYQKMRVNQIFREFDYRWYIVEARVIKEDFMDAIDSLDLWEINRIIWECKISENYRIQQFWRTLTNWYGWIKWLIENSTNDFKFTNAFTEGMNNSCKLAKRQSYWFKYKDNYFRKLFAKSMIDKTKNLFLE